MNGLIISLSSLMFYYFSKRMLLLLNADKTLFQTALMNDYIFLTEGFQNAKRAD
jgi:hypothetical protein